MESGIEKQEKAFLFWLNALKVNHTSIVNLNELSDGMFFNKLLFKVNPKFFPLDLVEAHGKLELEMKNLKKLNSRINSFWIDELNGAYIEENIDFKEDSPKRVVIKLCSKVLGILGNSIMKDLCIDTILTLEPDIQSVLMEAMMKYIKKDESHPSTTIDIDLVETLQIQLNDKDIEKNALMEQLKRLESENEAYHGQLLELEKSQHELIEENSTIKEELKEYKRKSLALEATTSRIQREKELEDEIFDLTQDIEDYKRKLATLQNEMNSDVGKLKDELFIAQEKIKKYGNQDQQMEQYKKKIKDLELNETNLQDDLKGIVHLEKHISQLQSDKSEQANKLEELIKTTYNQKSEIHKLESQIKQQSKEISRLEKESASFKTKYQSWETKGKSYEIQIADLTKELDSMKLNADAGSLLSQEKEANYRKEIEKLRTQIELLSESNGEGLKTHVLELEGKVGELSSQCEKTKQELYLANTHHAQLEKENEQLKEELH